MNKIIIAAASAVLLTSTASIASAQEAQGTTETEILKKKPGANSAAETAPGQQQKAGEVDSATEAAPGQQMKTGEIDSATDAAPGQVKQGDQAQGEQQQQDNQSASENAPGQQQKSGEVDTAKEAAPGQQMKSGEVDSAAEAAPGQMKIQDQATGETDQPSSETTASIDISTEQRTEVTQVFRAEKADPVTVDFDINVGVVIPRTVVLHPLPPRVIEIVPAYRSYQYFVLADGRIIIVEPNTLRIVYVLVV